MKRLAPLLLLLLLVGCHPTPPKPPPPPPPVTQWIPPLPQQATERPPQVFGAAQGKRKPPRPPASRPSKVSLFVFEGDLPLGYDLKALGVTHVIWVPAAGPERTFWGPCTDEEIRASAAKASTLGLPFAPHAWSFSNADRTANPWGAEPAWQAFLHRVSVWRAAGASGILLDCEDYPGWGVGWWNSPGSSTLMAQRAGQYAQALAGGELSFCGSYFKVAGTNRSGPTVPHKAVGLFQFINALPSCRWLEEETYRWGPYSNKATVVDYWRPWIQGGFPRAAYVPGVFLRTAEDTELFPYAGASVWIFGMPGYLKDPALRAALARALGH